MQSDLITLLHEDLPSSIKLYLLLKKEGRLSQDEMGARLNLDVRQVRRLIEDLRNAGIEIVADPPKKKPKAEKGEKQEKRRKFFYLPGGRAIDLEGLKLKEEEILALAIAGEASLAALAPTPLGEPLRNAFSVLLEHLATDIEFESDMERENWHFNPMAASPIKPDIFKDLSLAIREYRSVRIDYYTASTGEFSADRLVDPYGIAVRGGSWLLVAYCHKKHQIRDFSLAGISALKMGNSESEIFTRPEDFKLADYFHTRFKALAGNGRYHVRFRVEPDRVEYFRRKQYHASQKIVEERGDKRAVVSFDVTGLDEVRSFAQSWGVGITVLEPPELVEMLREEAEELHGRYQVRNGHE